MIPSDLEVQGQPTSDLASGVQRIVNDFSIQIATVNGSGSQSANAVLLRSIFHMGVPVSGKSLFPSNIAGLPTWFTIRVSNHGWIARKSDTDILIAMNPERSQEDVLSLAPGAAVIFDGFVRNNFKGQRTLYLEYEAYEPMAYTKLRELATHIHTQFGIHRLAIVHRLGRLEVGDTSVFIAVSAPHRAAAFDACRYVIDTLKRTVPIWKKEFFIGGAVWAEGESLPQEANSTSEETNS